MKVAVLGASGLVGRTMLRLLEAEPWVTGEPVALTSERSEGCAVPFRGRDLVCRRVQPGVLQDVDVVLCSAGREASRLWAPQAARAGALVVDNSSAWRMEPEVPLVVPEVNPVGPWRPGDPGRIIANPNCSTIQIAVFAAALQETLGLDAVHVVTFQAVSGAGQGALDEWRAQEADPGPAPRERFPRLIAANVIPAIGQALPDGAYEEEAKVVRELRRILGRGADLKVSCTAVRVPVHTGHGAAVRCLLPAPTDRERVLAALTDRPGLVVARDPHAFATPLEAAGRTEVLVGRIRLDPDDPRAVMAWVVADNLLKGAAWNAVQIVSSCLGPASAGSAAGDCP